VHLVASLPSHSPVAVLELRKTARAHVENSLIVPVANSDRLAATPNSVYLSRYSTSSLP
jgi:hypothetical protein